MPFVHQFVCSELISQTEDFCLLLSKTVIGYPKPRIPCDFPNFHRYLAFCFHYICLHHPPCFSVLVLPIVTTPAIIFLTKSVLHLCNLIQHISIGTY